MAQKPKVQNLPDTPTTLEPPIIANIGRPNKEGKVRETKLYKVNPFTTNGNFSLPTVKKTEVVAKNLKIVDDEKNQIADGAVIRYRKVDPEKFLKIFTQNVGAFFDLGKTAQRVLIAVMAAMQAYKDRAEVYITYKHALTIYEEMNIKAPSRTTFSTGMTQLVDAQFIAASNKGHGWFWTNPNILFNGSRVAFVELLVNERAEELKKLEYTQESLIPGQPAQKI